MYKIKTDAEASYYEERRAFFLHIGIRIEEVLCNSNTESNRIRWQENGWITSDEYAAFARRKVISQTIFGRILHRMDSKHFPTGSRGVVSNHIKGVKLFKYSSKCGKINQKTKEREPLAVRSVRSYKSILYAVFSQAAIDGLIKVNPVVGLSVVPGKRNKDYSEDYLFLTETEISELLGLRWDAISFEKKTISIQHTIVRVKTVTASDTTKTLAGRRVLPLFPTAEQCLLKIKAAQDLNKAFFKDDYKNRDGYVFTREDGSLYNPNYVSSKFQKATAEFGRPEITLHKLRHSCTTFLLKKWDLKQVQYFLGHRDANTTLNIYAHFDRLCSNTNTDELNEVSLPVADLFS